MTSREELLPCPCCGGEARHKPEYAAPGYWVRCDKCGLGTSDVMNRAQAASLWNKRIPRVARTPPEPSPAQVNSACLSYRHDFGMIGAVERERTQFEAREWLRAWQKEGVGAPAKASPSRKQIEAVIDDYLGNIDATYEDSRQRCAQRIVDLYAVTSTDRAFSLQDCKDAAETSEGCGTPLPSIPRGDAT